MIEEVLYLLEDSIKIARHTSDDHKTLVAIRKLAELDLVPENKVESVLNLFMAKKEEGNLYFEGITALEQEKKAKKYLHLYFFFYEII